MTEDNRERPVGGDPDAGGGIPLLRYGTVRAHLYCYLVLLASLPLSFLAFTFSAGVARDVAHALFLCDALVAALTVLAVAYLGVRLPLVPCAVGGLASFLCMFQSFGLLALSGVPTWFAAFFVAHLATHWVAGLFLFRTSDRDTAWGASERP